EGSMAWSVEAAPGFKGAEASEPGRGRCVRGAQWRCRGMSAFWPILVTGSHLTLAAAGGVPDFDVGPTCRVAADIGKAGAQAARVCRGQERRARETLRRTWQEY